MRHPLSLIVAALLFALFALQLALHATRASATIDEPTHLIAGYRHLTRGDFGINREHPPLLKIVAALPLLAMDLRDPLGKNDGAAQAVAFEAGAEFVLTNGIDRVVIPARAAAMIFSLALAALVFAATRAMFGPTEGLIALAAFAFEPALIAHGSLITNDMALAATLFATVFAIHRYKEQPTIARLVLIGIAAGLTLASKHSGVIVLPLVVLFLGPQLRQSATAIAIAVLVLFATYGFHPHMYFDGFRVLLAGSERAVYLFDRVHPTGRWYYFPLAFAIKTSVITLVLLPFAIASRRWLLLIPPALFLGISMFAGINIGVRHILPLWPFVIVAGAGGLWAFAKQKRSARIVVAALLLFHAINTAAIAPSYIAFGNYPTQLVFKDSNVEWGQNMKLARDWLAREGVTECWFAAYGHGALSAAQQPCRLLPAFGWSAGRIANAVPEVIEGTVLSSVTALPPRGGPEYAPITNTQPVDLIGGSVLVYHGTFHVPRLAAISHATRALQWKSRGDAAAAQNEARRAMELAPDDPRVRRAWATINEK